MSLQLLAAPAAASCGPVNTMKRAVRTAPAVFVGTVVGLRSGGRWATASVEAVWKGDLQVSQQVEVRSGLFDPPGGLSSMSSVDRFYKQGMTYLFVPFRERNGAFRDNACTRTTRYRTVLERFNPSRGAATNTIGPLASPEESDRSVPEHPIEAPPISGFRRLLSVVFGLVLLLVIIYFVRDKLRRGGSDL